MMGVGKIIHTLAYYTLTAMSWVWTPLTTLLFSLWYDKTASVIPPVQGDILLQPAVALARKIRSKMLKAEDVMEKFIARVKEVDGQLNAVVATCYDEALAAARQLDIDLSKNANDDRFSEENMPFLGVPLSVKESFALKGMPNSSGLVSRANYRSDTNAVVVERLKKAGAIPFCLTNTSELCMWYESANRLYGRTNNAYNTSRIVGGSSGGEACNISSGAAVIGVGSDIGGSIRMPAFFNGVFGHKPSRGLVPNEGQFPSATGTDALLLSTGPICRYIDDVLPMLRVMAGQNKQTDLETQVDLRKICIYNIEDDGGSLLVSPVDPQLKQAQARAVHYLETVAGATVRNITIPKLKYALDMWTSKMTNTGGKTFGQFMGGDVVPTANPYTDICKWLCGRSEHTLPAIALCFIEKLEMPNEKSLESFCKLEEELNEMLDDHSIIIYPSHPKIAPYHNQPLLCPFNFAYTGLFNALGYPVTQVPLGLSKEGLPLGVQIAAGMNHDCTAIAVARELTGANIAGWVSPGRRAS